MKKIITASAVAILSMSAGYASAAETSGIYLSGKIGDSIIRNHDINYDFAGNHSKSADKTRGVFGGGVAVGYDFYSQYQFPMRVEIESMFRGKSKSVGQADDGSVSTRNKVRLDTYMLNGYYDFHNQSDFTPYITAGLGVADVKLNNEFSSADTNGSMSGSKTNFAWDVGVGVKYSLTENIAIDASYKYIDGGKADISRSYDGESYRSKIKASSNDLMIGASYTF